MFTVRTAVLSIFVFTMGSCTRFSGYAPQAGDVVFQDLESSQGQAVKLATGSE